MARGWESKSVESQQADIGSRAARKPASTPEQRQQASERYTLELALAQTQAELAAACRPAHKDMLHQRLQAIRERLATLP
jgi:HD superfamily phosphodiesterase